MEEKETLSVADIPRAIEAILFAAGYPVPYEKICEAVGLSKKDLTKIIEVMAKEYQSEHNTRGIMLLTFPDTCQLVTKERFMPYIRVALSIKRGGNLSASSLETLAIVAYNQPVTRADVDNVRGVDSSYAMTSLVDKGLIVACGTLDAPGRPRIYETTDKFLKVFGLSSLEELPEASIGGEGGHDVQETIEIDI